MTKKERERILNGEPKQSDLQDIRDNLKLIQHVLMDMNTLKAIEMKNQDLTPNEREFVNSVLYWMRFGGTKEESVT